MNFDYILMGCSIRTLERAVTVLKIRSYRTQPEQVPYYCTIEVDPDTVLTVFSYRSHASHVYRRIVPLRWFELSSYLARLSPVIYMIIMHRNVLCRKSGDYVLNEPCLPSPSDCGAAILERVTANTVLSGVGMQGCKIRPTKDPKYAQNIKFSPVIVNCLNVVMP